MEARKEAKRKGVLSTLRKLIKHNRLGELLVIQGMITPRQLKIALRQQKSAHISLGKALLQGHFVSRGVLYRTLGEQVALRVLALAFTIFIGFSALGAKSARAAGVKDIPAAVKVSGTANISYAAFYNYPDLFGSQERRSYNLSAFKKWTGMFQRFDVAMQQSYGQNAVQNWRESLKAFGNLPLDQMAGKVNSMINNERYVTDSRNWGQTDYWATPVEFLTRGGDCEDFAIAKYVSLRALGVPEERLRIAIVHDKRKNIPHAVLIVYTDRGAMLLDNQIKQMRRVDSVDHYRPIFSINRQAWWLHTKPSKPVTVIASAAR